MRSTTNSDSAEHEAATTAPKKRKTDQKASKQLIENSAVAASLRKEMKALEGELGTAIERVGEFTKRAELLQESNNKV
jgi:hypothetical protein